MTARFKSGDVVRLKTGTLTMTVGCSTGTWVLCTWVVDGRAASAYFDDDVLVPAGEPADKAPAEVAGETDG